VHFNFCFVQTEVGIIGQQIEGLFDVSNVLLINIFWGESDAE